MMMPTYRTRRRVEFHDTDAAGIAHFSAFLLWMEQVEHEFLRSRGLSVLQRDAAGAVTWPRVAVKCDFQSPIKFEDVIDVELRVARLGAKSATYAFRFTHAERLVATGELTAVCVRLAQDGSHQSIEIPSELREKISAAEPTIAPPDVEAHR